MHLYRRPGLLIVLALALPVGPGLLPARVSAADQNTVSAAVDVPGMTEVQQMAAAFFEWRRRQQPVSGDDIPRVERPDGWVPDWSPAALADYRQQYLKFFRAVESLDTRGWDVAARVDARLLRAAIQRVHWELDILGGPHRNPLFYVQQTLGSLFELLLVSSPMNEVRALNVILRLEQIPATLDAARTNLDHPVRPFAEAAIESLSGIEERLARLQSALEDIVPAAQIERLGPAIAAASSALRKYAAWLESGLGSMQTAFAPGPVAYQWFLTNVALIPHGPVELLAQGRSAWNRAVALEAVELNRNRELPPAPVFETMERQVRTAELQESEIRAFLESQDLMTVPDWLGHYRFCPLPAHLEPLAFLGVTNDLTSEYRLGEDACRYLSEPSADLPYFALSAARDPRPLIIHEGLPGHYFQLAQSWRQPDPIRRRYIGSSVNEGIGLYAEELLLQAGLFDFSPRTREIIYSFARLRAMRVEVDIRLAVGDLTIQQAADQLARAVPMDRATALEEATFFASNPGRAISYQVGKLQIIRFLADARLAREDFSLRDFHDYLMRNGNVPIALQRWEYLGDDGDVLRLDALGGMPVTVPQ